MPLNTQWESMIPCPTRCIQFTARTSPCLVRSSTVRPPGKPGEQGNPECNSSDSADKRRQKPASHHWAWLNKSHSHYKPSVSVLWHGWKLHVGKTPHWKKGNEVRLRLQWSQPGFVHVSSFSLCLGLILKYFFWVSSQVTEYCHHTTIT